MTRLNVNTELRNMRACSNRGSAMGRRNVCDDEQAVVMLGRVIFEDGCYDLGGAYWGLPADLWCAMSRDHSVMWFGRAESWLAARRDLLEWQPDLVVEQAHDLDLESVVDHYLEAALYFDGPEDDLFTADDISEQLREQSHQDCAKFVQQNVMDLLTFSGPRTAEEQAGHDLWLTRNHHGSGFWDGDWDHAVGERLTEASQQFRELSLFRGADGKIYAE